MICTDYVGDMMGIRKTKDPTELSFEKAAMLLDAATKVYGCRVDSLSSGFYKVLCNVAGSESGNTIFSAMPTKGGKRKDKHKVKTLLKHKEISIPDISQIVCMVDAMQCKTSSSFSAGDIEGLFLLTLKMFDGKIALDENTTVSYKPQSEEPEDISNVEEVEILNSIATEGDTDPNKSVVSPHCLQILSEFLKDCQTELPQNVDEYSDNDDYYGDDSDGLMDGFGVSTWESNILNQHGPASQRVQNLFPTNPASKLPPENQTDIRSYGG
eukprot:UN06782